MNGQMDGWINWLIDAQIDEWMRPMYGWLMDKWIEGWMRWMNGRE